MRTTETFEVPSNEFTSISPTAPAANAYHIIFQRKLRSYSRADTRSSTYGDLSRPSVRIPWPLPTPTRWMTKSSFLLDLSTLTVRARRTQWSTPHSISGTIWMSRLPPKSCSSSALTPRPMEGRGEYHTLHLWMRREKMRNQERVLRCGLWSSATTEELSGESGFRSLL